MSPHDTRRHRLTRIWTIGIIVSLLLAPLLANITSVTASPETSSESNPKNNNSTLPKPRQNEKSLHGSFGKLPLAFEANQGQVDEQVRFMARGAGYRVFLTTTETVFAFNEDTKNKMAHGNW